MSDKSAIEIAQALLEQAEDTEDPWLLSYADLVTNLLAFMVLLVSMAGVSFETIDAVPSVFGGQTSLQEVSEEIVELAKQEGLEEEIAAKVGKRGLEVSLPDQFLFPSGVAALSENGKKLVSKLAPFFSKLPAHNLIDIEGHTDDVPISTARFASNWELSAARALVVRKYLSSVGVDDQRMSISAFADTRPVSAPQALSKQEIRRRNRRVVIRVHF